MDEKKEQAFLLQISGDEYYLREKLGFNSLNPYGCPIDIMRSTGYFGILDALLDLNFTASEISDFYIQGHVEPYNEPYTFAEGIINIVYGMKKEDIKEKYEHISDERISKLPSPNRNTQMLLSFCYSKNDTYQYIPNAKELSSNFERQYQYLYNRYDAFSKEKEYQKIDGRLFRTIRYLVRHGYDFPSTEDLFNDEVNTIVLKQTNGNDIFNLDKKYALETSDNLLSLVCFLEAHNYKIVNPKSLFNKDNYKINIVNPDGVEFVLNCSDLEPLIHKYDKLIQKLNYCQFSIPDILSLCNKKIDTITLECNFDSKQYKYYIKRNMLQNISYELLEFIKKSNKLGFSFKDNDNLFDTNQELLKVTDPSGKEHLINREEFNSMLDIVNKCEKANFTLNIDQLLNLNESIIELTDKQGNKAYAYRERINHLLNILTLLKNNGYYFKDYSTLFDESNLYITCYDRQNQERVLGRKQLHNILRIEELQKKGEKLNEKEQDIASMLNNYIFREKLFEWLPYTAKKWIPSSSVIIKIPAEQSDRYFYNNNYARLQLLKDEYQTKTYTEAEGLVSLGFILGLFDTKESTSQKAVDYIINYFLKKGITADELHTTYGAINLQHGYNKNFADFFMKHYTDNPECFVDPDLGTNMTGELYERFDEVLQNRPEKRIKTSTRNKLLTPSDAIASITNIKVDKEMLGDMADDERFIRLAELLLKFGAHRSEIEWSIELYKQALAIDEQKVSIPNIEDMKASLMKFKSHLKSDPQAFVSGRKTNCCSRYGGYAQDRLTHVITDLDWRYVTFTSPNRTFFDGLVWYDKEDQVVCIDNVEGQFSKTDKKDSQSVALMADTFIRYADGIYSKMNELNIPCRKVNVGNDSGTASWEIFRYAKDQKLIIADEEPCKYPKKNGITTDAEYQFTITDEQMLKLRKK